MVQRSWNDAFDKPRGKAAKSKAANPDRPKVFPSMLSILEANALVTHVRGLQEEDEDDDDDDDLSDYSDDDHDGDYGLDASPRRGGDSLREQPPPQPPSSDPAVVASVLSILPAGYDWNKAILQMAQSRSRAFLLLDLAAIVRRTVLWKRAYPGVTWVHSVNANANAKLLQVLLMAGVRLATTTRSDVAHALNAQSKIKRKQDGQQHQPSSSANRSIADSTTHAGAPDSYLRELVSARVHSVTVDGPDEVHRVVRTVQRVQRRHGSNPHGVKLGLVLRLHPSDVGSWMGAADGALRAMESYPVHELSGISLDVGMEADGDDGGSGAPAAPRWSAQDRQSEAVRVKDRILKSYPLVAIHLTGFGDGAVSRDGGGGGGSTSPFPPEWVQWWTAQQSDPRVREVSVECSSPLVASAGALCTRIIGVRRTAAAAASAGTGGGAGDNHKQHLYIDDGCYGSLYQTKGELKPIPLGNYKDPPPPQEAAADAGAAAASASYTSTVWGPTCDGLDRVCRDIPLPRLERDDWLVFPNLGCPGGLGTAFNGFEPPDTAYCVLGYFKK
jgi:ornithine decarboxylase